MMGTTWDGTLWVPGVVQASKLESERDVSPNHETSSHQTKTGTDTPLQACSPRQLKMNLNPRSHSPAT
jgi:hypothetical protein